MIKSDGFLITCWAIYIALIGPALNVQSLKAQ